MEFEYGKEIAKLKVAFSDPEGKIITQTFNNLKSTADPKDMYYIADKIGSVVDLSFETVYKISEAEIIVG